MVVGDVEDLQIFKLLNVIQLCDGIMRQIKFFDFCEEVRVNMKFINMRDSLAKQI